MEAPESTNYSHFYVTWYVPHSEKLQWLEEVNFGDWKQMKDQVVDCEKEYIKLADGDEAALARVGLTRDMDGEDDDDEPKSPFKSPKKANVIGATPQRRVSIAEGGNTQDPDQSQVSGAAFGGTWVVGVKEGGGEREAVPAEKEGRGYLASAGGSITVSGSDMGMGGAGKQEPQKRVKQFKRKNESMKAIEKAMVQSTVDLGVSEEYVRLQKLTELEEKLTKARRKADKYPEPAPTLKIRFYTYFKRFLKLFLSHNEANQRVPGHVRYNEIILALLYWNKERNIVPQKMMEKRLEQDQAIQFEVAFQLISAVCTGGVVRRRRLLDKAAARKRLRNAHQMVLGGRDLSYRISKDNKAKIRRKKIAPQQNENARKNLWMYDNADAGPMMLMCCSIARYELATGSQLADVAEENGFEVGADGIFELGEDELKECLDTSQAFRDWRENYLLIEHVKTFLQDVTDLAPAYLRLAAKVNNIQIGEHFEYLTKMSITEIKTLLSDPRVMAIMPAQVCTVINNVQYFL